jgi:cobalt-zinc-cadmium efflux system membrane fusion protein
MSIDPFVHRRRAASYAALLLALAGVACRGSDATAEEEAAMPVVTARTAVAAVEPFTQRLAAIGSVVARPGRYAALSAPSATRIARVYVAEGQRIGAGQPLVEFEQAQFASASSAAQAALAAAQRNAERARRLANEGILPRKDAESATADLAKARADAIAARRAAQLSVLRSPVSGVVTRMTAVLGAPADAGQVLVEVADPSAFDVVLSLGASDAASIIPGRHVELTAGDKPGGESIGAGTVASVGAAVDSGSRSVQVRVTVTTPSRALRLGESVLGTIAVETRPDAVVVPIEALVPAEEPGSYRVFVVDKAGLARAREVTVGGRTETKAEVTTGLKGGEVVVTQGAFGLTDSAKVARPGPGKP